ncbi:Outer membrane protein assembly factor BamB [uncultured archaeon]|nr:Outer membrane protein assembly factor BamB [uncultured archaeon]
MKKRGKFYSIFFAVLIIISCISLLTIISGEGSDTSSTRDWLMFGRTLNNTRYYPDSVNMTAFGKSWGYQFNGFESIIYPSSPIVVNDMIYFAGRGGGINTFYAVNITNQSLMWSDNWNNGGDQVTASPSFANGIIYTGTNGKKLYALNATTGTELWHYPFLGMWDNPYASIVSKGIIYFGVLGSSFYALNSTDGTDKWNYAIKSQVSPSIANDIVYVPSSTDNYLYALNATDGTKIWNSSIEGIDLFSSPAVVNNIVYVGSEDYNVYAFNATNGTKIWNYTTGNKVTSSPAVVNNIVYVGSNDNNVYAFNATNGTKLWNYDTGGVVSSSPAVANNLIFIGNQNNYFYALNITDGTEVWSYITGNPVYSSPAIANNTVFLGSSDNVLYAFTAGRGGTYTCSTWGGCDTAMINAKYGDTILLTSSFSCGEGGTCISFYNKNNITIDCANNSLFGVGGILLSNSSNNTIKNCFILGGNTGTGISITGSSRDNLFYNNFLNNFINYDNGTGSKNYFNTTKTSRTNILNGAYTAGNFWATPSVTGFSQTCEDANNDGICDSSYDLDGSNYDYSPLKCYESWVCTSWSTCSSSLQTRYCTDRNACGTTKYEPVESQSCSSYSSDPLGSPSVTEVIPITRGGSSTHITIRNPKIDLTSISINLSKDVNSSLFSVIRLNDSNLTKLPSTGKIYQSFEIISGINNSNIANAIINFKINKTWLSDNNLHLNILGNNTVVMQDNQSLWNITLYRKESGETNYMPLITTFAMQDNQYYYFKALTPGFSTFVVFLSKTECAPNTRRCFNNQVQLCLGNSTWLVTEQCKNSCENAECSKMKMNSIFSYTIILSGISSTIVLVIYFTLLGRRKNKFKNH